MISTAFVSSDITIAGQSAPGDGIGFIGNMVSMKNSSNVIIRYVRFRQGDIDSWIYDCSVDMTDAENIILDHVSAEFSQFDQIDAVGGDTVSVLSASWAGMTAGIPALNAPAAVDYVLANAGASLHRDSLDLMIIADVRSFGTQGRYWTSQTESGLGNSAFGTLSGSPGHPSGMNNGIPEDWARFHGLDPADASIANGAKLSADGYTNLEMYLNELAGDSVKYAQTPGITASLVASALSGTGMECAQRLCRPAPESGRLRL